MSRLVIVHDYVFDAITAKVKAAIKEAQVPDDKRAEVHNYAFNYLLDYFNQHGVVPEFTLTKKEHSPCPPQTPAT